MRPNRMEDTGRFIATVGTCRVSSIRPATPMLFSGGSANVPKKDTKKDRKPDRDEKLEIQENVFIKFANSLLGSDEVKELKDLGDSLVLASAVRLANGQPITLVEHRAEDVAAILRALGDTKTNPTDICDGSQKAILNVWWAIVQSCWKRFAPDVMGQEKLAEVIRHWCVEVSKEYEGVTITDFTSSFRDGHAFNILLHSFDRKSVNLEEVGNMGASERLDNAFTVAEKSGVPRLLVPKDLHSEHLDSRSTLTYLMCLYLSMLGCRFLSNMSMPSTSMESSGSQGKGLIEKKQMSIEGSERSRKSSSSSQKSSKSKRKREDLAGEFESCLEHVLAWLLEADEEISALSDVESNNVQEVKRQFKEYERMMASLTESQETVGKVLHRGQLLCQHTEDNNEKAAIQQQLMLVNSRWEEVRGLAMARQATLQTRLTALQHLQLEQIANWLTETEAVIEDCAPIADIPEAVLKQLEEHTALQKRIKDYQTTVDQLGSFVAVVDEDESEGGESSVVLLERRLHSVGIRWQAVCEWAEKRAASLDGLSELCVLTEQVAEELEGWLHQMEQELTQFKSPHHLETSEEVEEQVEKVKDAEQHLEDKHKTLVSLSRLSEELVGRLESDNGAAACAVRRKLHLINSRWENLAARLAEQSRMLVQSGKIPEKGASATEEKEVRHKGTKEGEEPIQGDAMVERFLHHVAMLEGEMLPLTQWTQSFQVNRKPDMARRMIAICQEKLIEIKEKETKVNTLQLQLEHLHMVPTLTSNQLKTANDAFQLFNKRWANIVTKISDALNVLSGQSGDEETRVARAIDEWLSFTHNLLTDLAKIPLHERTPRIEKISAQLAKQKESLDVIERDTVKRAILSKGLSIVENKLQVLSESDESTLLKQLEGKWCSVGDLLGLEQDLSRAEKLVAYVRSHNMSSDIVEKAETRRAEVEERARATRTASNAINSTRTLLDKISAKRAEIGQESGPGAIHHLTALKEELLSFENLRKEAERANEKMLRVDEDVPEEVVTRTNALVKQLSEQWRDLLDSIHDSISLAQKELDKAAQKTISERKKHLDELEEVIINSQKASDAEEYSEALDRTEQLMQQVHDDLDQASEGAEEGTTKEWKDRAEEILQKAEEHTRYLSDHLKEAERFEQQAASFTLWAGHIQVLLSQRRSVDVDALDVPTEYKQMSEEFEQNEKCLADMKKFAEKEDSERAKDQVEYAEKTMDDIRDKLQKFRQPVAFEQKVNRLTHKLAEMENNLDEMTGISCSQVADCLSQLAFIRQSLSLVVQQFADLDDGMQKLLADQFVSENDSIQITEKLRLAKKKTKDLSKREESCTDRLENSLQLISSIDEKSQDVEKVLDELEKKLEEYGRSDRCDDVGSVEEMIGMWNRNEANLNQMDQLHRQLTEYGVRPPQTGIRRRANTLKERIDGWYRAVKAMNEDQDALLLQVEQAHSSLQTKLDEAEGMNDKELLLAMDMLRGDRDRLSSSVRRLCALNPRLATTDLVGGLWSQWDRLEKRLEGGKRVDPPTLAAASSTSVEELLARARSALLNLDFDQFPVHTVSEWKERVQKVDDWLCAEKATIDSSLEHGKKLAESGRMELEAHKTIELLDDVVHVRQQIHNELEHAKPSIEQMIREEEELQRRIKNIEEELAKLHDHIQPSTLLQTRKHLMEKDEELSSISRRAAEIHAALPGQSSAGRDTSLDKVNQLLSKLEAKLSAIVEEKEEQGEEKDAKRKSGENIDQLPKITVDNMDMDQVYVNLDLIEEQLAIDNEYPMENIQNASDSISRWETMIAEAEDIVDQNSMTMDIMEHEHTHNKIESIKKDIIDKKARIPQDEKEWQRFKELLETAKNAVNNVDPDDETRMTRVGKIVDETLVAFARIRPRFDERGTLVKGLQEEVHHVETKFHQVKEAKERIELRDVDENKINMKLTELEKWCHDVEADLDKEYNSIDKVNIPILLSKLHQRKESMEDMHGALLAVQTDRDIFLGKEGIQSDASHSIRRRTSLMAKGLSDLRSNLNERVIELEKDARHCTSVWERKKKLVELAADTRRRAEGALAASIYTPSVAAILQIKQQADELRDGANFIRNELDQTTREKMILDEPLIQELEDAIIACEEAAASSDEIDQPDMNQSVSSFGSSEQDEEKKDRNEKQAAKKEKSDSREEEVDRVLIAPNESISSITTSTADEPSMLLPDISSLPSTNLKDEKCLQALRHVSNWLVEANRECTLTVDIQEVNAIKQRLAILMRLTEEAKEREEEVHRLTPAPALQAYQQQILNSLNHLNQQIEARKADLNKMADSARIWNKQRTVMEIWLTDALNVLADKNTQVAEREELMAQLENVEELLAQWDDKTELMKDINAKGNQLILEHPRDDNHTVGHALSHINTHWTTFNDSVRIRRAFLEASLRSRKDMLSALTELEEWVNKEQQELQTLLVKTSNTQAIKDVNNREKWTEEHEQVALHIQTHNSLVQEVHEMAKNLIDRMDDGMERAALSERMRLLNTQWTRLQEDAHTVKNRLDNAQEECKLLQNDLTALIGWVEKKREALASLKLAGNLSAAMGQLSLCKNTAREMEDKGKEMKNTLSHAHSYLIQNDLRPKMHEGDDSHVQDMNAHQIGMHISMDCERLKDGWKNLEQQLAEWTTLANAASNRLQELERALAESQLVVSGVERQLDDSRPVEQLRLEELRDAKKAADALVQKVLDTRPLIDEANAACSEIRAVNAPIDAHTMNQLEAVNQRYDHLRAAVRVRAASIGNALNDFGPSSEHFLAKSVTLPWQRNISQANGLPYYINHTSEATQWDHPLWLHVLKELSTFNRVKFIAYRTAMKLRALQKRLCLDLIGLGQLEKIFARIELSNEECMSIECIVSCLVPLFEEVHAKDPHLVKNVPLAVDLAVNMLLSIYDPGRDSILRVLSFKVALVVFCDAPLEDKYRKLFELVSVDGQVDHKHMALLFYDMILIPKLVGECAAFGGSNIEPSVRSLFESAKMPPSLSVSSFLSWLRHEPQSVVWLPVMHRLALAEFAKHQAKCNVCKMFPLVGLRYRCLRCFNFDMCQNCFFSQRTAKNHKLKHPMQEYSTPTTSGEDVRDFGRIVRNKLGRSKKGLGYLPLDVGDEGQPLVTPPVVAHNPQTESMHNRIAECANRLTQVAHCEATTTTTQQVNSPLQLITQVDRMQKEELDQLLQRLQLENIELKRELVKKKNVMVSTPDLDKSRRSISRLAPGFGRSVPALGRSVPALDHSAHDEQNLILQHKNRLEHRSRILAQQNEQLEMQLQRVKSLIDQQKSTDVEDWKDVNEVITDDEQLKKEPMQCLLAKADELGKAMEMLMVSVLCEDDSDY